MDTLPTTSPLPTWASFFTSQQMAIFQLLVEADITQRGLPFREEDGVVLTCTAGGQHQRLGLQNLAQRCRLHAEREWADVIEAHFTQIFESLEDQEVEQGPLAELRPLLKVRLYGEEIPAKVRLISRPVAPGVVAVLTLDLPRAVKTVSPDRAVEWGVSEDELMDLGLVNALAEPHEQHTVSLGTNAHIELLTGASFYVTTQALALDRRLPHDHPYGALVAIPNRHTMLLHVIEGSEVVGAIQAMLRCAGDMCRQGPGSISSSLFWWRGGEFTALPAAERDDTVVFRPPSAFVGCLERVLQPRS